MNCDQRALIEAWAAPLGENDNLFTLIGELRHICADLDDNDFEEINDNLFTLIGELRLMGILSDGRVAVLHDNLFTLIGELRPTVMPIINYITTYIGMIIFSR